jgi:PAS domain S-box-containing protein
MIEVLTVLIVEDNPAEADLIMEVLNETGPVRFKVESVSRLSGALRRLEGGGIDVVLLDLGLPDSQGLNTVVAVKSAAPQVPIVVLTGYDDEATGQAALREGAQDYLVKGTIPGSMLARVLHFAVERQGATEALRQSKHFAQSALDGLSAHIAIIDESGTILAVNRAWREFAEANLATAANVCEGANYLAVCDAATGDDSAGARQFAAEARAVLTGREKKFAMEYPCHSPEQERWFVARVTRFSGDGPPRVVIAHENITERKREELARLASLERQKRINQLQQALLAPGQMEEKLHMITDGVVDIFAADFCRIWQIAPGDLCELGCMHAKAAEGPQVCRNRDKCLRLIASSGRYTHTDGEGHRRVPLEAYKIGLVASGQEHRFLTNDVTRDPLVHDQDWARELGLVSFAAYQLRPPGGERLGVLALFRTQAITAEEDAQLDALSAATARVIGTAQAELALQESEQKYRNLHESMRDGFVYVDMAGRIKESNESYREMVGYSNEELLQLTFLDLTPARWRAFEQNIVKDQILLKGYSEVYEKEYRKKDGTVFPVELRTILIKDGSGENQGMWAVVRDITERKRAEEALKQAEEKYRSIFEHTVEGIFQATPEGRYLSVNPALARMCGFENPEAMMIAITDIATQLYVNPEDRAKVKALYEGAGIAKNFETQFRRTDGRLIWVSINSRAVRDAEGSILYYEGTIEDITERKQAEEDRTRVEAQLRQAQKMEALGTLAGGIAHDFNNILGIIVGYSEMAQMDASDGSRVREDLQEVLKATHRAKDLVQQILAFSRRGEQERKSVQVGLIVKEVLKMLRASLPSTVEIKMDVTSRAVVFADPTQVHQVLMNLCTNAAHAMRDHGGVLEVSLTDVLTPESISRHSDLLPGPYVKLTVKDTGQGIDPLVLDRIFDPFFTTKEKGVGTGLGLSVVHGIVKSHGGALEVESHLGEGAAFQVFFPAMERAPGPQICQRVPLPRGRERVLLVDDEPALALVTKQMLENLGYGVDYRTNGLEALDAFRHQRKEKAFDLVITDMTMPHLTGDDLARELLRLQPNLPIILCTGFSEKMDAEKAKSLGIQTFLMKPVVLRELAETVRKVLDKKGKST